MSDNAKVYERDMVPSGRWVKADDHKRALDARDKSHAEAMQREERAVGEAEEALDQTRADLAKVVGVLEAIREDGRDSEITQNLIAHTLRALGEGA